MAPPACLSGTGMLVLYFSCWFVPSIGLTLYNKWFFRHWNGDGFQFPIFVTMIQFCSNAALAQLVLLVFKVDYDRNMTWRTWAVSIVPIGVGTAVDIVLSNLGIASPLSTMQVLEWLACAGYLYLSITLMTIIKSGTAMWILLWSFLLKLEKPSVPLVTVVLLVTGNLKGDSAETTLGIMMAGFARMHPAAALRYTAPVCAATLLPAFLLVEMKPLSNTEFVRDGSLAAACFGLIAIAAPMALMLILTEFQIIQVYSAVTMTVGGVVKELLTIGLAVVFFSEELTWNNLVGAGLVILAVLYYAYHKSSKRNLNSGTNEERLHIMGTGDLNVDTVEGSAHWIHPVL